MSLKTLRLLTLLLFGFWAAVPLQGQSLETDTLESKLEKTLDPNARVDVLNLLAWSFRFSKLEKAKKYATEAIAIAEENQYVKGYSSAYNTLALIVNENGNPHLALEYFNKSIAAKEQIQDIKGKATVINNKGIAHANLQQWKEARDCYETALKIRQELGDKKGVGDCYNQLGKLARDLGNYQESLQQHQKALEIRKEINDKRGIAYSLVNIGGLYNDKADFLSSLQFHQMALPMLEELKDKGSLVVVYNNLGIANKQLKNFPDAIRFNEEALRLAKETGHARHSINAWKSLGDIYLETEENKKALQAYQSCLELAIENKQPGDQAHCYSGMGKCHEREGDLKSASYFFHQGTQMAEKSGIVRDIIRLSNQEAYFLYRLGDFNGAEKLLAASLPIAKKENLKIYLTEIYKLQGLILKTKNPDSGKAEPYFEKYAALKDSIYKDDLPRQFAEMQTRFETEKKEAEIKILQQKEQLAQLKLEGQEREIEQRNLALVLAFMALIGLALAGFFYFKKQKAEEAEKQRLATQKAEEAERIRLAKDIHDEFGSGLTKIRFITDMVMEKAGKKSELAGLLTPISKTATQLVDNMRDLIWVLHPANNTVEILVARIREYANEYLEDFGIETRFDIEEPIPNQTLTKEVHRQVLMVIKEALQNIAKHANANQVYIHIYFQPNATICIEDNGLGFEPQLLETKGNGLSNMDNRMKQMGGSWELVTSPGNGTKLTLQLPSEKGALV